MGFFGALRTFSLVFAMLCPLLFPFEPATDANFPTTITLSVDGIHIHAKITYFNMSYYQKAKEDSYPHQRSDFYVPGQYSKNFFSASTKNLPKAKLNFTFNNMVVGSAGFECSSMETNDNGEAVCTATEYYEEDGTVHFFVDTESCGTLLVRFDGNYSDSNYFQPSSRTAIFCPPNAFPLSVLGDAIFTALSDPQNLPVCFPLMLIVGFLVSSMYYSGRDPLSLFDLTTPRLPRVKQFRLKQGTAPQMVRSITRRYMMMQRQAERDILNAARLLAADKATKDGLTGAARRRRINTYTRDVRELVREYKKNLLRAAISGDPTIANKAIANKDFSEAKARLNMLFDSLAPKDQKSARFEYYKRTRELLEGWFQMVSVAEQANRLTGVSRGGGGGPVYRFLSNRVFDPLTRGLINVESNKIVRGIARTPIVSVLVTGPTKTLDVLLQYRATRRGAIAVRRNMYGSLLYNALLSKKSKDDQGTRELRSTGKAAKRMFERDGGKLTLLGGLTKKWKRWTFSEWESRVDLASRRANPLKDISEFSRLESVNAINMFFEKHFGSILSLIGTKANKEKLLELLEADMSRLEQKRDRARTAEGREKIEHLISQLRGQVESAKEKSDFAQSLIRYIEQRDRIEKGGAKLFALTSRYLKLTSKNQEQVFGITEDCSTGRITMSEALRAMYELAEKQPGMRQPLSKEKQLIGRFAKYEAYVRANLLVMRDAKTGAYLAVTFKDMDQDRMDRISSHLDSKGALSRLKNDLEGQHGGKWSDVYDKMTAKEVQDRLLAMNITGSLRAHLETVNKEMVKKYDGKLAAIDQKAFNMELRRAYDLMLSRPERIISGLRQLASNFNQEAREKDRYPGFGGNSNQMKRAEQEFVSRLMTMNMYGNYPAAFYLSEKLRALGIKNEKGQPYSVNNMNDAELLFRKGVKGLRFRDELARIVSAGGLGDSLARDYNGASTNDKRVQVLDKAFGSLVTGAGSFAKQWESRLWTTTSLFNADSEVRKKELSDFLGAQATTALLKKISPAEAHELAMQRSDFRVTIYSKATEDSIIMARRYDQMAGLVSWRNMPGASWGEDSYGRVEFLIGEMKNQNGMLYAMYKNLVNEGSKFYDKKFADDLRAKGLDANKFDAGTYQELIKRGYTFADMRRGMGFIISGDKRGGTPALEFDAGVLRDQLRARNLPSDGKADELIIVRKDRPDIRDLTPLFARLSESPFINLPAGLTILIRHQKPDGTHTWVYGDPNKDAITRQEIEIAKQNIDLRKNIGYALAGIDSTTMKYDSSKQRLMVVSTNDFRTYAKTNPGNFFGAMSEADMQRESIRSALYGTGERISNVMYGAFHHRVDKMNQWFVAQMQVRFALEAISHKSEEFMKSGNERFGTEDMKYYEGKYESQPEGNQKYSDAEKVYHEVERLKKGDNTFWGNAEAAKYNFLRNIAAKTVQNVTDAEKEWYTAKLEIQALENLHKKGEISEESYSRLNYLRSQLDGLKEQYGKQRKEFKELNEAVRGWTGSHTGFAEYGYGSTKSPFTMLWFFSRFMDSKWVQGTKTDFYQITESSAMRDPRSAIGAGPGLDYSFYVGYQTGQAVYERMSMWGTNALWEVALQNKTLPSLGAHKFFNDYMSYASRKASAYPAWFEMDPMYPGRHGKRVSSAILAPIQQHYHSDWMQSRFQSFINYSGAGQLIGSYIATGSQDPSQRSFFKKAIDWAFIPSTGHYGELATWRGLARPLERFRWFEFKMNEILKEDYLKMQNGMGGEWVRSFNEWNSLSEGDPQKKEIWDKYFEPIVRVYDPRPLGTREAHSGRDIHEDGSRNRFMELYSGFHSNMWKPTIPALLDVDPVQGRWRTFPQVSAPVDRESLNSRLGSMGRFTLSTFELEKDEKGNEIVDDKGNKKYFFTSEDQFSTHQDAFRDVYTKNDSALLHLAKLQSEINMYSSLNSPFLYFFNPIAGLAVDKLIKPAVAKTKFGSNIMLSSSYGTSGGAFGGGEMEGYNDWFKAGVGYGFDEFAQATSLAYKARSMKERLEYRAEQQFAEKIPFAGRYKRKSRKESADLTERGSEPTSF